MQEVVSIDPGFSGTGWAFVSKSTDGTLRCDTAGVFTPLGPEATIEFRIADVTSKTLEVLRRYGSRTGRRFSVTVAVELPKYMPSPTGQAAAGGGNLTTLFMCVAGVISAVHIHGAVLKLVPVNDWKGTMTKAAVTARIRKRLGCAATTFKSHEWDAVGVGLYELGAF